jgi:Leucine-rich repeat (LRR) protein
MNVLNIVLCLLFGLLSNYVAVSGILLVPSEYDALREIYYSTNGPHWTYERGVQLDFKPWEFTDNRENNPCDLWYGLLCIGFDTYNGMEKLLIVNLTGIGNMTGRLPPTISNFTQLLYFVINNNPGLTGDVPKFELMPNLQVLNLSSNSLRGTIPDCWSDFQSLNFLSFANNRLHGSIPTSIYELENMMYISFFNNSLGGTISHMLANMVNLISFNIGYNKVRGRMPTFIRTMQFLEQFLVENNELTGPIPLQLPSTLRAMQLNNNYFTSTIPATICAASNLTVFAAANNRLSGTLPECFGFYTELMVLQLQSNMMAGPVRGIFDPYTSTNLWVLDLTDNAFSGSFPAELFHLPGLMSLGASKNCFTGSLPESICNASSSLQIIAMDGLQSGGKCALHPWDPLNLLHGYVTNLMRGTLPDCVWTIPNLEVLHMAGNGLQGTLPGDVELPTSLKAVSMTHNELSGTIPYNFLRHTFTELDLSFNNLQGRISDLSNMPFSYNSSGATNGATLSLQVNHLSGRVPESLWHAWNTDVLNGNLFTCSQNRHDLPRHDPEAADYFCGSTVFDNAAALFVLVFVLCILPVLVLLFGSENLRCIILAPIEAMMNWLRPPRRNQAKTAWEEPVWMQKARLSCLFTLRYVLRVQIWMEKTPEEVVDTYAATAASNRNMPAEDVDMDDEEALAMRWSREEQMRRFGNFYRYVAALTLLRRVSFAVCIVALCICLPTYLLFYQLGGSNRDGESQYSSVHQRYSWITTSAFLAGAPPAGTLFALWVVLLWWICYLIARHYNVYLRQHMRSSQRRKKRKQSLLVQRLSFAVTKATDNLRESTVNLARDSFSFFASPNTHQMSSALIYNVLRTSDVEAGQNDTVPTSEVNVEGHTPRASEGDGGVEPSSRFSGGSTKSSGSGSHGRKSVTIASPPIPEGLDETDTVVKTPSQPLSPTKSLAKMRNSSVSTAPQALDADALAKEVTMAEMRHFFLLTFAFLGIFLLNFSISIAINAAYLLLQNASRLTTDAKTVLQLGMAAFKLLWNMVAVRILVSKLPYSRQSAQLHVILLLTNTVLAPCLAVAFTDSSCFSDFFFGADQVCTWYELALCLETSQMYCPDTNTYYTACSQYEVQEFVTEFAPSFIYYYGCTARVLTSYIPVYLYSYTLLLIAVPVGYTLLSTLQRHTLPSWILSLLDGVVRPQDRDVLRFRFLMRPTATQAMLTQHLIVLVTFGVNAPLLALVMALAIAADTFAWQFLLARYLHFADTETPFSPEFLRLNVYGHHPTDKEPPLLSRPDAKQSLTKDDFPPDQSPHPHPPQQMMMVALDAARDSTTVAESFVSARTSLVFPTRPSISQRLSAGSSGQTHRGSSLSHSFGDNLTADEEDAEWERQLERERRLLREREQQLEARLNELHTVIGRAWRGPRNTMWLIFYCGVLFNAGMLFDVCGYATGWKGAIWLPMAALVVVFASRLGFMEVVYAVHGGLRRSYRSWMQRKRQRRAKRGHSPPDTRHTACCTCWWLCAWTRRSTTSTNTGTNTKTMGYKKAGKATDDQEVERGSESVHYGVFSDMSHSQSHSHSQSQSQSPSHHPSQQHLASIPGGERRRPVEDDGWLNADEEVDEEVVVRREEAERHSGLDELLARSLCCCRGWRKCLPCVLPTMRPKHAYHHPPDGAEGLDYQQRLLVHEDDDDGDDRADSGRLFSTGSARSYSSRAHSRSYSHSRSLFHLSDSESEDDDDDEGDEDEENEYEDDDDDDEKELRRREWREAQRDGVLSA